MDNPTRDISAIEPFLEAGEAARTGEKSGFLTRAAEAIGSTAGYVRSYSFKGMLSEGDRVVRGNPLPAVAGAAAVGFMLGTLLRRI